LLRSPSTFTQAGILLTLPLAVKSARLLGSGLSLSSGPHKKPPLLRRKAHHPHLALLEVSVGVCPSASRPFEFLSSEPLKARPYYTTLSALVKFSGRLG